MQQLVALLRQIVRAEVLSAVMEAELLTRALGSRDNIANEVARLRNVTNDSIEQLVAMAKES